MIARAHILTAAAAIIPASSQLCHWGRYSSEIIGFAKNSSPYCGLYGVRLQIIKLNR